MTKRKLRHTATTTERAVTLSKDQLDQASGGFIKIGGVEGESVGFAHQDGAARIKSLD